MSNAQAANGGSDGSVTAQAQEKVQETAQKATQKSAQYLREQTETRAAQASTELQSVAEAMRKSGHQLRADGKETPANALDGVTKGVERVSSYLGQTSGDRMLQDIESFGRRSPWGMIGLGLGVGIVASRFLKASSRDRFQGGQQFGPVRSAPPLPPSTPVYEPPAPVTQGVR